MDEITELAFDDWFKKSLDNIMKDLDGIENIPEEIDLSNAMLERSE